MRIDLSRLEKEVDGAVLSEDRQYRYVLWRCWDASLPSVMIIGLNPSTADEKLDDPTLRRCINFAKSWGYGRLYMTNLFAFRATNPNEMMAMQQISIGPDNDAWLSAVSKRVDKVILAWGTRGAFLNRDSVIIESIKDPYCIAKTIKGFPKHPLYLKGDLVPIRF